MHPKDQPLEALRLLCGGVSALFFAVLILVHGRLFGPVRGRKLVLTFDLGTFQQQLSLLLDGVFLNLGKNQVDLQLYPLGTERLREAPARSEFPTPDSALPQRIVRAMRVEWVKV